MEDEAEVLEQRVEVPSAGRGGDEAGERVRGEQDEREEAGREEAEHGEHPRRHLARQAPAPCRHREGPPAQDERPEEQRPLVGAPDGGQPVVEGQQHVRVGRDVEHGEVVAGERPREAGEGGEVEHEEAGRGVGGERHPAQVAARRARERGRGEEQGGEQCEDERELAELRDHGRRVPATRPGSGGAAPSDSATSGGM